ncbi:MAG: proline dehydrogenase, partial [Calditrichaeota bacterium]
MHWMRTFLLWASENSWLRERATKWSFVRRAVRRFMPGETVDDAIRAAKALQEKGIATVFTELGENITHLSEAEAVADHYSTVLERLAAEKVDGEISLKLTHLGLDLSPEKTYALFRAIAQKAHRLNNFVWIDMESSAYTDVTIEFYERARKEFANTGLCVQAYLYRTEEDIRRLMPLSPAIRLVKGAYREPKEIAFPGKKEVDENYYRLALRLLQATRENGIRVAYATHDMGLIGRIREQAEQMGMAPNDLEVQMLYGIRTREQVR